LGHVHLSDMRPEMEVPLRGRQNGDDAVILRLHSAQRRKSTVRRTHSFNAGLQCMGTICPHA
jgi:hypothetical protein